MSDDILKDGRDAERLLNDPTLQKALQRMENDAVEAWKAASTKEKREECHANIRAVDKLRTVFEAMKGDKSHFEAQEKTFGRKVKS